MNYVDSNILVQVTENPALQPFLPFLFVLAIVFGLLEIVDIFKRKSVNVVLAFVFAFFAAGYEPFVTFFFAKFGLILWGFVFLFFVAFIMEAIGMRGKKKVPEGKENLLMVVITIIILILGAVGFTYIKELEVPVIGTDNLLMIIGLLLLVVLFFFAYEYGSKERKVKEIMEEQQKEAKKGG